MTVDADIYTGFYDGSFRNGYVGIAGYVENGEGNLIFKFQELVRVNSSYQAEYVALKKLLELAVSYGIENLTVYGDCYHIVLHSDGYNSRVKRLTKQIPTCNLLPISRDKNQKAHKLACIILARVFPLGRRR